MAGATPAPKYARIDAASRILGIGRSRIYELIASRDLVAVKVGWTTLVDIDAALAWISAQPRAEVRRHAR